MASTITEGVLFESAALGDTRWTVRSLEGEDALNHEYRFRIHLDLAQSSLSQDELERVLEAPASITFIEGDRELNRFSGVIAELTVLPDVDHTRTDLYLELVPRTALAAHRRGSELFLQKSVPEVVVEKLKALGLEPERDFALLLRASYGRREFIAQYEESDLAFVRRLCEAAGITTSFEERDGREVMVLSDGQAPFQPVTRSRIRMRDRRDHPSAWDVRTTLRRVPQNVQVHDYNYRIPRVPLLDRDPTRRAAAVGEWTEFGPHPKTTNETRELAVIRTEEHAARHNVVQGMASESSLRSGRLLHIVDAVATEQTLLLTRVEYSFRRLAENAAGAAELHGWENRFVGIPDGVPFRPPRATPVPRISGLLNAVVDGAIRGDYAELDPLGRYRVRFAHDRSGRTDLGATHPVRMMQPHAGASYGMHFPLRPGTEVLVGFVNGDPDRPVIVGAAPNPITTSPVAERNQTQNVIRTGSNNEMVIEDFKGNERIRIHTPHAATTMQLGSPEEAEEGVLFTTEANHTAMSRRSNNTVTDRHTTIARSTTAMLGERAVMVAGLRGIAAAADNAIERPGAVAMETLAADLRRLSRPPVLPGAGGTAAEPATQAPADASALVIPATVNLQSGSAAQAAERTEDAALELVRAMSRATDYGLDSAQGRLQGEPMGVPAEPAAIIAGERTAALIGREVGLVSGDRVAALSSPKSAAVLGQETAVLKSGGDVEVAGARRVHVTTSGELDLAARTARLVAGYYPEAEAPKLDEGTSLGVMARRDLRVHSVEDCILLCANKNLIGSAHNGDARLHAQKTVQLQGGSIHGSAGQIAFDSSGDVKVDAKGSVTVNADGNITLDAAADIAIDGTTVTITADTIRLVGTVLVQGNLFVTGETNL
ncbi:MAG: type VI secretion system tip protein VgrG [Polyangiaceae bacterium]|nr:type VI secretion system tip protein VgrG [Polyangiaceae bacterium]